MKYLTWAAEKRDKPAIGTDLMIVSMFNAAICDECGALIPVRQEFLHSEWHLTLKVEED